MMAAAGASGARIAIAHYFRFWLTPKRLRRITIALGCAALLASTVTFGGTSGSADRAGYAAAEPSPASGSR
jgi:hypothetical protein